MSEEKKIFIDEDWKTQVQAEKEELQRQRQSKPSDSKQQPGSSDQPRPGPMPPASFEMHLSMLATEAMVALGQLPNPATGKEDRDIDRAKYLIDMLDVLQQKTQGNLTGQEEAAMNQMLHQLRVAFVSAMGTPKQE